MKEKFGKGEPDRIEYEGFEDGGGDATESESVTYRLYYGEDVISVDWLISKDQILGICGTGLLK